MASRLTKLAGVAAVLAAFPMVANAAGDSVTDLKARIKDLNQRYQQQNTEIQEMRTRLRELEVNLQNIRGRGEPASNAYAQSVQQEKGVPAGNATAQTNEAASHPAPQAQTAAASDAGEQPSGTVGKQPERSQSAQAVYEQAQGTVFSQKFTLEPSFTYSRFDRRQITLSGFLALDAIFLGSIAVQEAKADVYQFDLTGRWGVTPRLQLYMDIPYLYRYTNYFSGGAGGAAPALSEAGVHGGPNLGDISIGGYYQLWQETASRPDLVANVALKVPTGTDPYGIKIVQPDPNNNNMRVPQELPTGNGVFSLFAGLSVLKTVDPVILFANAGVYHNFQRSFDDISTTEGTTTPGDVDLGNSFQWGAGMALALNGKMAMTFSYSQLISQAARTRVEGGDWQKIVGSDANSSQFNLGLTYALSDHETMITSLGIGLSPDAPDFQINVKFPYTF